MYRIVIPLVVYVAVFALGLMLGALAAKARAREALKLKLIESRGAFISQETLNAWIKDL